jgi:DNA-binding response OmpR family regulator
MATVLLATDADWVFDEVFAALDGPHEVSRVRAGADVEDAVFELEPDIVLLDLQIGNMGGVAACLNLRLEARAERLVPTKVLILLDREADIFLARRAEADGWLVKPLDSMRIRRAVQATLQTGAYTEGIPEEWQHVAPLLNH